PLSTATPLHPHLHSRPLLLATSSVSLLLLPRPPTSTLFPYTTLFRSAAVLPVAAGLPRHRRDRPDRRHGAPRRLRRGAAAADRRSEEHTSELQSPDHLVCRLLLEKKKRN